MKTTRVHKKERLLPAFGFRMLVVSLLLIFVATMPLTVAAEEINESPQDISVERGVADPPAGDVPEETDEPVEVPAGDIPEDGDEPVEAPAGNVAEDTGEPEEKAEEAQEAPAPVLTQSAASEVAAVSDGDAEVTGAGDSEDETYSVLDGSAYIYEIGKTLTYENDANEGNAIGQGMEAALTYIQGLYEDGSTTERVATLVVSAGTYENGITLDASEEEGNTLWALVESILGYQSGRNDEQITLRIVAEDAIEYDDEGNITGFNAASSGQTQLEGDINILAGNLNLNLVLAGLYLSTRGLVNADGVDELTIYGTEKDDYLSVNATDVGSMVTIDTGAGNDVVTANISGRAGVTADAVTCIQADVLLRMVTDLSDGSVADTVSDTLFPEDYFGKGFDLAAWVKKNVSKVNDMQTQLSTAAAAASVSPIGVRISTGDGNDRLNLNLMDSSRLESGEIAETDLTVDLSAIHEEMAQFPVSWLTKLSLYVDISAFDVTVDGGNGSDALTVTGTQDSSNAYPLVKAASDYVYAQRGFTPTASVFVNGGAGDDVITVDGSVFLVTRGTTKVSAEGGTGFDRLHLTGKLDGNALQPIRANVTTADVEFTIQALAALTIQDGYTTVSYKLSYPGVYSIVARNVDAYTDTLENKNTVSIGNLTGKVTAQPFTNYLVEIGSDKKGTVSFDAADYLLIPENVALLLTNILVQAGDDQLVTIQKLLAPDLNVIIDSDKIKVTGTVTGQNILLIADAEDRALIALDVSGSVDTGIRDGILPSEMEIEGASLGIYETTTSIYIKVTENAKIIATQAVALNARLRLYHDYIPGLELLDDNTGDIRFNPVTVKMGNATVSVTGTIHAGGSVEIAADVDIDVDVTNGDLKVIIPVAIGVIGGKATVTVKGNGDIRSGMARDTLETGAVPTEKAGTLLRADSTLKIAAHAGSGVFPISVALAVLDFETATTVSGNANILAGGDVTLLARNHTVTSVSTCGYETNKYTVKVKSGVFIAGTYGTLTTDASLKGKASLRAVHGDVSINGLSRMSNTTVSVAIPGSGEDGELTLSSALPMLAKLIDLGGIVKSVAPRLLEKAGLDKLSELFTSSAGSAGEENKGVTQALGAFAWTYIDSSTAAEINTTATVQAAGTLHLYALGEVRSEVRGDGSLYKVSKVADTPKSAIGAGLALTILQDKVDALISGGRITAGGLDIRALLGDCVSTAVAKAGHLPEAKENRLGLAGAVGVQLSSFENTAAIASGVTVRLTDGAGVNMVADGSGRFVTVGDASGKRQRLSLDMGAVQVPLKNGYNGSADSTAIGAGIAVATIGVNTLAEIQNGVTITLSGGKLGGLTVRANFDATQYVEATAGAQGGTSLIPVLALSLGGMDVNANVGTGSDLNISGDGVVTASGSWERTLVADAQTGGAKVGIGAAVAVNIASDRVNAALNRSITANNIIIEATSVSQVTETVYASAKGVTPQSGSGSYGQGDSSKGSATQEQVEKLISGNKSDSAETTATGGVDGLINKMIATLSGLAGKLPQSKSGNLSSGSVNDMGSSRSPAGTGEGNVEVAAAIGVNLQTNRVSATVGDGLTLVATGDIRVLSRQDTDADLNANASAVKSTVGVGVAVAVNWVQYQNLATIGTGTLNAGGNIQVKATIFEEEEKRAVEEILSDLVKYFANQNGMEVLLGAIAKNQGTTVDNLMNSLLKKYHSDFAGLSESDKKALSGEITAMLIASLSDEPMDTSVTLASDVLESILGEFRDMVSDPDFFLALFLGEAGDTIEQAFHEMKLDGKMTLASLRALLATAMTEKFGNPGELDGIGCRITTVSISGEGAANVGVAGSVAISHVDGTTLAQIAGRDKPVTGDIEAKGIVTIESNGAQKIYTTATASTVANGAPDKNTSGTSAGTTVGVGASFAMTMADGTSKAILGKNRSLTSLALGIRASIQNDVDTIAVAGQDPIGVQQKTAETTPALGAEETVKNANNSTPDDIGADAAVALTILTNTVHGQVSSGCVLTLTGGNILNPDLERGDDSKETLYNLIVNAFQRGQTLTSASGFAVAGKAAVGASVALNVAGSDVLASLSGSGNVKGGILVNALTSNEDVVNDLAVITGVNLDRYLSKLRSIVDLVNTTDKPSTGSINASVVNAINGKAGGAASAGSNKALPLSGVLLQKLNISLPDVKSSEDGVNKDLLSGSTSQKMDDSTKGQSVNIAAALGVNITNHMSVAKLDGKFSAGRAEVNAENRANYRTTGSGATVTTGTVGSNNISAGVAVSVNNNQAESVLGGKLGTNGGKITLTAHSTSNMDGKYPGLLAAQAIAGAVGGSNGKVGLAGAVAVVVDQSRTKAHTLSGTELDGGDITVKSLDKSKLSLRSGALQAGGQTVGVGASFAILYARNSIFAGIGDNNTITAKNLRVQAIREKITAGDYVFPFDWDTLFTANVGDDDSARKGLININISENSSENVGDNSLELNLSADDLLKILDLLNYGTMTNYYVEAIAGGIAGGAASRLGLAGAVSFIYATTDTLAQIGEGTTVTLTEKAAVEAENQTRVRQIAGALGASRQAGVGVNMVGYVNQAKHTTWDEDGNATTETLTDQTAALVGTDVTLTAPGGIQVTALADMDVLAVAIAAGVTAGAGSGASIGGTIHTIAAGNVVKALVGQGSTMTANAGSIQISADNGAFLLSIAASVAGGADKVAAGGTVSVIVVENETLAAIGDRVQANAGKNITVQATSRETLINWFNASAISTGSNVAGIISVLVTGSRTTASAGDRANLTAQNGSVEIHADGDVFQVVVMTNACAGAGSGGANVGAVVSVDVFRQEVAALVGSNARLVAKALADGNNVLILAEGRNRAYLITAAGSVGTSGGSVSGAITTVVSQSNIHGEVGNQAGIQAGDTIEISATLDADLIFCSPNIALTAGNAGVGATVTTFVVENRACALVGDGVTLIAGAAQGNTDTRGISNRANRRRGLFLRANTDSRLIVASVCAGAAANGAVSGTVTTVVLQNQTIAQTGENVVLVSGYDCELDADLSSVSVVAGEDGEISVEADDESDIYIVAGAIGAGSTAGVGASVVTVTGNKTVTAETGTGNDLRATGNVNLSADSRDLTVVVSLSFALSGSTAVDAGVTTLVYGSNITATLRGKVSADGNVSVRAESDEKVILAAGQVAGSGTASVAGGSNALVLRNAVLAELDGMVQKGQNLTVQSDNNMQITNALGALGGAGSAAVTPVAVVTWYKGSSQAILRANSSIQISGTLTLAAYSVEKVNTDGVGAAASGTAAVSGAVAVAVSTQITRALAEMNVSIRAGEISLAAEDSIQSITAVGVVTGSGSVSVGVIAAVTVLHNTVEARLTGGSSAKKNTVQSTSGDISITAKSLRDIRSYALNLSGSGTVAVAPTVMVLVVGGKLDSDSADLLDSGFSGEDFADSHFEDDTMSGLSKMLEGDGQRYSDIQVGDSTGKADFSDGYVSGDFTNGSYNDNSDTGRGENYTVNAEGNSTIVASGDILNHSESVTGKASTTAIVGSVKLISAGDITLTVEDLVQAELLNAAVAGSGMAAVGTGLSVAVLYSNVISGVESGASLEAAGDITIEASSHSMPYANSSAADKTRNTWLSGKLKDKVKVTERTIRVVSLAASGAVAGVSVVGSAVSLSNQTKAYLNGNVTSAKSLTVSATVNYPHTLAATIAAGAGVAGVTASFAVAVTQGQVSAGIGGKAGISNVSAIRVQTHTDFHALAASAALAGGGVGVNGGVAVAVNRMKVSTFVGKNVSLSKADTLDVTATHTSDAVVYLMNVAGGGVAAGVSAVVSIVSPTIHTYIGVEPGKTDTASGTIQAGSVSVTSTVTSAAAPRIYMGSAGGGSMTGAVLVVINNTDAITGILRKAVTATNLAITANMTANATADITSASVGAVAMGATVAYVQLRGDNEAVLDTTGVTVSATSVTVKADATTNATAKASIVNAGGKTVNANIAIGDNRSDNTAHILGSTSGSLSCTGDLTVEAVGTATAVAELSGLSISGKQISGVVAVSVLRATQSAAIAGGTVTAKNVSVTSTLNVDITNPASAAIHAGGGAMASLKAFIAVAYGRSESTANVQAKSLTATGNLTVSSKGNAGTVAKIDQLSVSGITGTAMAAFAYAQGKFQAQIQGGTISANNITVEAKDISASAAAQVVPSALGADISLAGITVNLAIASTKATIRAAISGSAGITAGGKLTVEAVSTSTATAEVKAVEFSASGVSIAASVACATVGGSQTAAVEGGTVDAASVRVYSEFNYAKSYYNKAYDAHAAAGISSGAKLSYINASANVSRAVMNAAVTAKISAKSLTAHGDVEVLTLGGSRAKADVAVGTTVSAYSASILTTLANAAGSFTAQIVGPEANVEGNVLIQAKPVTDAQAFTANMGAVDASGLSGKYNSAQARAATTVKAGFTGWGTIRGTLSILATGSGTANAKTVHPKITVSGIELAANQTSATLSGVQEAGLQITHQKKLTVGGDLTVQSTLTGKATGDVGGGSGSISVSGLTADVNSTQATATTSNQAYIGATEAKKNVAGSGSLKAGAVTVKSTTTTTVDATTKQGLDVSLASFGGLSTQAFTRDTVKGYVENVAMEAYSLSMDAQGNATAYAESNAMGSVSAVSAKTSKAEAGIGSASAKQTVYAGIGDKATITLTGNLTVKAWNHGSAEAYISKGTGIAITATTSSKLPTVSYYDTRAYVGTGSAIHAGGNVTITAEDSTEATSKASSNEISFGVNAAEVYGSNTITTNILTKIGKSSIFASGNLTVKAISNTTMYASTQADGGSGFKDKKEMIAKNILTRTTKVTLADGAELESDFGNVELLAQSGTDDSIQTYSKLTGTSFAAYEKVSSTTNISTTSEVTINKATITNPFGTVHIWADASLADLYTDDYAYAAGVGTEPSATAKDTITLISQVLINKDGTSSSGGATLTARNLEIHAKFTTLEIESFAFAKTKSLGSNADAKVEQKVTMTGTVNAAGATFRGYDYLRMTATGAPAYKARNIYARAKIYLGAIGHGKADVQQTITSSNQVKVGSGVVIYSANATIEAVKYAGTTAYKQETSGFVYQQKAKTINNSFTASTSVDSGTRFYIGDAAGGIQIDIYEKNGKVQVRQVGIKDEKNIWVINSANKTVLLQAIANNLAGYLTMAVTSGSYTVYDQRYIPSVSITNRTDYSLELKGLTVENDNYIKPRVTLDGGSCTVKTTDITQPTFTVTSLGTGGVKVSGFIANPRGSVSFLWEGKTGGDLTGVSEVVNVTSGSTTAPVWAHRLTIKGAANVGTGTDERFPVWLITHSGEALSALNQAADISLDAAGDVFLALTPVWMKTVAAKNWASLTPDTTAFDTSMDVHHIAAAGDVDVLLKQGIRLYRKEGTATITMPVPGTLEYITDAVVGLSSNVTISDRAALESYLESYDLATGISVYYLPNGTRLYTDSNGVIIRIVEGGVDFGLGEYSYDGKTDTITLVEGVKFDLTSGTLTIEKGYSYEALLSAISGKWLLDRIQNGTFQLLYMKESETEGEEDTRVNLTISEWYKDGTSTWYFTSMGSAPTSIIGSANDGAKNYILVYDSSSDTLRAFLLTGGGDGGTSNTIREELSFYDDYYIKKVDTYYDRDKTVEVTEYWDPTVKSIKKELTSKSGEKNEYYLVQSEDYFWPKETLAKEVSFTSFMTISADTTGLGNFQSINYNSSDGTWTVTYRDGSTTKTATLNVVSLGSNYFGVSPDAAEGISDSFLKTLYENLSGSYWKVQRNHTDTIELDIAVWTGEKDKDKKERLYYAYKSWPLYAYAYSLTYGTLTEIGMAITPEEDENVTYTHGVCFETDGDFAGAITITGKTENIAIKQTTLPTSSLIGSGTTAYRITDSLYIQNTGDHKGRAILLNGDFVATYNSLTGVYESTRAKITRLTPEKDEAAYAPVILIKSGQKVMLEAITDTIARDMTGNYYQYADGSWTKLTASTTGEKRNGVYVDKAQGTTIDNVTVYTTTLKDGSETLLTIQQAKATLYVVDENENGILAVRYVNSRMECYLLSGGVWTAIDGDTAEGMGFRITLGETYKTWVMTASTYITLQDGRIVGSDGTVEIPGNTDTTQKSQTVSGIQYQLGDITGANVTITMEDTAGSLIDANDTTSETKMNITATAGDVTFVASSTGSIGTQDNPLEVSATGKVKFRNLSGEDKLEINVYLECEGDLTLGDILVDGQGEYGGTKFLANSTKGSISFGNMTVIRGGLVNLTAATDILSTGKLTVSTTEKGENEFSLVTMVAGKNLSLGDILVQDNSQLNLTAGETVTTGTLTMNGNGKTAQTTVTAGSDGILADVAITDGKLTIDAAGNVTTGNTNLSGETTVSSNGDVTLGELTADGKLTIDAAGNVTTGNANLTGETTVSSNGDVTLGELTADGKLTIDAAGRVTTGNVNLTGETTIVSGADMTMGDIMASGSLTLSSTGNLTLTGAVNGENSNLNITAGEDISLGNVTLTNSSLEADAGQSVYFTTLDADGSRVTLTAGENIRMQDETGFLSFHNGVDTGLTLNAVGDIGCPDCYLAVDTDAPISIPRVNHYYITSPTLEIQIGEATGSAFVDTTGDITIRQSAGKLTVGTIQTSQGNVTLIAENGDIEGGEGSTNLTGREITLTASGSVGSQTPLTVEASLRLNMTAGKDGNILATGDLPLGRIYAEGDISLAASGSILDARGNDQPGENLIIRGNGVLTAQTGSIGTWETPLTTDVAGTVQANARDSISIRDSGTLDLIADSENGQVNAIAAEDISLGNTRGDLVLGVVAAGGTAAIRAEGSLVEGDRYGAQAQVTAKSIGLTAKNGDIGTVDDPFDVDTDWENGGTLTASGNHVYLNEVSGDLILSHIHADGDGVLTAPGNILDGNTNLTDEAVEAKKEAAAADAQAKAAEAQAYVKSEEARIAQEALEKAREAYDKAMANTPDAIAQALGQARDALAQMTDEEEIARQEKYIARLETEWKQAQWQAAIREQTLQKTRKALKEAEMAHDAAQDAWNAASAEAEKKRQQADASLAQALAAAERAANGGATVETGGDLTLVAGGNVGSEDNSLSVGVDGTVNAHGKHIYIAGLGDLHFGHVDEVPYVRISTVDGTITSDNPITADALDISAVNGDVGQADNYLAVSTDYLNALGDHVYIRNDRDTVIGQIIGENQVVLEVDGDVTGDGSIQPNIIAGNVTIRADGDIGTREQPLDISADSFHGTGEDIFLNNHSGELEISNVESDSLRVNTDGNVTGKDNRMYDIIIRADGYVGTENDPFQFWANGYVSIRGELGTWFVNSYFLKFQTTVVLRFELTIAGQDYSLYVLIGMDEEGECTLIGWFLCKGRANSEIWTEVLEYLHDEMRIFVLGTVIVNDEPELEACLDIFRDTCCLDIHERGEEVGYEPALREVTGDRGEELTDFIHRISETLTEEFPDGETTLEKVEEAGQTFADQHEYWHLHSNGLSILFEDQN